MGACGRPPRSGRHPRAPSRRPSAGAGPVALRADARLGVYVLPRSGGDHGGRPGREPDLRPPRPGVRRRAPLQLRCLRVAEPRPRLRHQRLRRDASGTLGVGLEAPRRKLRDRRPRPRLRALAATGDRPHRRTRVPRPAPPARRDVESRRLVPAGRGRRAAGHDRSRREQEGAQAGSTARSPRRSARPGCGPSRSSPAASMASCGSAAILLCSSHSTRSLPASNSRPRKRGCDRSSSSTARR